jgi:secreted PhoX family phosphatase
MSITRKDFLRQAGAYSVGFLGFQHLNSRLFGGRVIPKQASELLGPLVPDPNGIFDLPKGFSYKIISRAGSILNDGFILPNRPDGMATFSGVNGNTILIRNHEMNPDSSSGGSAFGENYELASNGDPSKYYDAGLENNPAQGGTTTLVFDTRTQEVLNEYLSLAGTLRNCAGGATPWNSWLTCEEIVTRADGRRYAKDHGYVFEVPASEETQLFKAEPIKSMGRFNHEAVAVDPRSNVIYLTEDDSAGLLYRFLPNTPGKLHDGGTLQALVIKDQPKLDTRNWNGLTVRKKEPMPIEWMNLRGIDQDDLRFRGHATGAARFARGEGMWFGNHAVYFACTNGGPAKKGQIWKYVPSPFEGTPEENSRSGSLELFVEPNDGNIIENADNLTVAPWGDLVVCEDSDGDNYLLGITPKGDIYKMGRNAVSESELAGATFSPDGSTLFMNIQHDGLTLAITGPWNKGQL